MLAVDQIVAKRLVKAVAFANVEASHPEEQIWSEVLNQISEDESQALPSALAKALATVALDAERLVLALRLTAGLNVVEAVGALLFVAREFDSVDALLTAAALSNSPLVDAEFGRTVEVLSKQINLSDRQRTVLVAVLSPEAPLVTQRALAVQREQWPSGVAGPPPVPVVVIEESAEASRRDFWRLSGELMSAGAQVRRISDDLAKPITPQWLPKSIVAVGWRSVSLLGAQVSDYVAVTGGLEEPGSMMTLLRTISAGLERSQGCGLRLGSTPRLVRASATGDHVGVPGQTMSNFDWARDLKRCQREAFQAVADYFTDPVQHSAYVYERLVEIGQATTEFDQIIANSLAPKRDALAQAIRDGVAAAVRQLLVEGRLVWTPDRTELRST